jgi:TonB family protein
MLPSTPLRPHDATPSMPIAEDRGRLPVPNGTRTSGTTATDGDPSRRLRSAMLASLDSLERVGAAVYRVAELERAVERDPLSAAPAYPSELEQARVEGDVTAEWVVDTVGRADTTSFRVVSSTHPRFLEAVRAALPLMHFRPAQLQGRRVQQLVRQEFNFRLALPAAISAHEAAAAVAPRVP